MEHDPLTVSPSVSVLKIRTYLFGTPNQEM